MTMLTLDGSYEAIGEEYGIDVETELLMARLRLDAPRMMTPIVARAGEDRHLLSRQMELGGLRWHQVPEEEIVLFEGYVTLDPSLRKSSAHATFADAVADIAPSAEVMIDAGMPYARYVELSAVMATSVSTGARVSAKPVVAYAIDRATVLERFAGYRAAGNDAALRVIEGFEHLAPIADYLDPVPDTRFAMLDASMREAGIESALICAPPNFSEVTGRPVTDGSWALVNRGADSVILISSAIEYETPGRVLGRYDSLAESVADLASGSSVGVEETWLPSADALLLAESGLTLELFSRRLSDWRDQRDREDIAFNLIAARGSKFCIEGALAFALAEVAAGKTVPESVIYDKYLSLIHDFRDRYQIPFTVRPYFVNLHASNRTLYPACPTSFEVSQQTGTVKLDAGLRVQIDGVVLGTSDMARTMVQQADAIRTFELFTRIIREDVIGRLAVGQVCEDVHERAMIAIESHLPELVRLGAISESVDVRAELSKRNVGHLMGKQESFGIELKRGHKFVLPEGSYGAAEIQWSYGANAFGSEDLWFLTDTHAIVITE